MAVLAGCTVGPDYKWPAAAVPADWRNGSEERESIANLKWWQLAVASYAYERPFSQNSFFIRGFPGAKASSGNDIQANVDLTFELDVGPCAAGYGGGVGGAFDQRYLDDDGSSKE